MWIWLLIGVWGFLSLGIILFVKGASVGDHDFEEDQRIAKNKSSKETA